MSNNTTSVILELLIKCIDNRPQLCQTILHQYDQIRGTDNISIS